MVFSGNYVEARDRFRTAAERLGWAIESLPIAARGPTGEVLTIDVACSPNTSAKHTLVVSSGVHGVEGLFGSAVQTSLLQHWAQTAPTPVRCVFLHALNPYGFAWRRRADEHNVDPNRNFLLPDERFEGAATAYAQLNEFLNPQRAPSPWEPFSLQAIGLIAKHGLPALRQAIAAGQYEYPQGLFFGGAGPSEMQRILCGNFSRWLGDSRTVVHLDFHTGLGRYGTYKLLIDYPLTDFQRRWLGDWFGRESFEASDSRKIAYDARGGFGRWCVWRADSEVPAIKYLFACAEFGTFGPIRVLAGLRAENQTHHWGFPGDAATQRAKQKLQELFCPAATRWRARVLEQSHRLIDRAIKGVLCE